jgi:hypothetical protein
LAEFIDGGVQTVVEVDERVGGPEAFAELLRSDHFAGAFERNLKNVKRAVLELSSYPGLAEFRPSKVGLVGSEAYNANGNRSLAREEKAAFAFLV